MLPLIAITMGDAAGIGPEVIMKAMANPGVHARCRVLVIGDLRRLEAAGKIVGAALELRAIKEDAIATADYASGLVNCIDLGLIPPDLPWGRLSATAGDAAYRYIEVAARLAMSGTIDAICTAPLNKEALQAGGHIYPGHTEMLAALLGVDEVSMLLTAPNLRVIHVTTHIGLVDAIAKIDPGLVERTILRGHNVLAKVGTGRCKIGVCGINPHAGENGLFGHGEETEKIEPAIRACKARGIDVEGPLPADTLFFRAARGDFDLVVAMYHDQGHIPMKLIDFEKTVNVSIGLPIIRTSADHGTAFDIAGKNQADPTNMKAAMRLAAVMASNRVTASHAT